VIPSGFPPGRGFVVALTGGVDFSHDDGWAMHPPFSLFLRAEKEKTGRARSKREKDAGGENLPMRANFAQSTGAGLNQCPSELPVFCRLRPTSCLAGTLRRSCDCF